MTRENTAGLIRFEVQVKIDVEELKHWSPERIKALMDGIAEVVAASKEPPHA